MARKTNKAVGNIASFLMWFVAIVATLAIGGLFTSGTTLGYPILSSLPEIVHTIVGWAIIVAVLVNAFLCLMNNLGRK